MQVRLTLVAGLILCALAPLHAEEARDLREALADHALKGDWIYDHAEKGLEEGRRTGKPVLISFRCVP